MVTLNTGNTTTIPIIPTLKTSGFHLEPEWLGERDELTDSYKRFYSHVMRRIGNRGYAFLSIERLAKDLKLSTRTISNHIKTSRELNLMEITSTGRSSLFVILWHEWMPITQSQADQIRVQFSLSAKISNLVSKFFQGHLPQAQENQVVNDDSKTVETIVKEPIEEVRSMQASEDSQPTMNITDSNIAEAKETPVINANTNTTVSKDSEKESILSKHSLEMCKRYTVAYAKAKSMTKDPITDIRGFSLHCFRTGKEDIWIDAFIENNYSITPINPSKDPQVEQSQEQPQVAQVTKQAYKKKSKPVETKEIKGKYPYQVYLDFVNYEIKQGQNIRSVEGLTRHLHTTGSQDNQVASFVQLMKNTYAGGKAPQTQNAHSAIASTSITTGTTSTTNQQLSLSPQPPSIAEDVEALRRATAIESLAVTAWQTLTSTQKEQLLNQTQSNLLETKPRIDAQMPKEALTSHITLVKYKLGEMLYNSNTDNLTALLQAIGKEKYDSLEDWEQVELQEPKIDAMGYFYSCCADTQSALLQEVSENIYLELGIEQLARRI